ncbi:MAG: TetR/AcrR family transcriptional regulator [Solirubrobacteraceae bacterium]|nr:TetR/AcrR family transcriptional regulator [Solirubrobacteraceae bacterium]
MATPARTFRSARARRRAEMVVTIAGALETMADQGAEDGPPIDAMLDVAGIARSTFYVHFEDKADLMLALAEHVWRELGRAGSALWEPSWPDDRAAVRRSIDTLDAAFRRLRGTLGVVVAATVHDSGLRDAYRATIRPAIDNVAGRIRDGQADGRIPAAIDADQTASWLVWAVERGLQELRDADGVADDATLDALAGLIWNLLLAPTVDGGDDVAA